MARPTNAPYQIDPATQANLDKIRRMKEREAALGIAAAYEQGFDLQKGTLTGRVPKREDYSEAQRTQMRLEIAKVMNQHQANLLREEDRIRRGTSTTQSRRSTAQGLDDILAMRKAQMQKRADFNVKEFEALANQRDAVYEELADYRSNIVNQTGADPATANQLSTLYRRAQVQDEASGESYGPQTANPHWANFAQSAMDVLEDKSMSPEKQVATMELLSLYLGPEHSMTTVLGRVSAGVDPNERSRIASWIGNNEADLGRYEEQVLEIEGRLGTADAELKNFSSGAGYDAKTEAYLDAEIEFRTTLVETRTKIMKGELSQEGMSPEKLRAIWGNSATTTEELGAAGKKTDPTDEPIASLTDLMQKWKEDPSDPYVSSAVAALLVSPGFIAAKEKLGMKSDEEALRTLEKIDKANRQREARDDRAVRMYKTIMGQIPATRQDQIMARMWLATHQDDFSRLANERAEERGAGLVEGSQEPEDVAPVSEEAEKAAEAGEPLAEQQEAAQEEAVQEEEVSRHDVADEFDRIEEEEAGQEAGLAGKLKETRALAKQTEDRAKRSVAREKADKALGSALERRALQDEGPERVREPEQAQRMAMKGQQLRDEAGDVERQRERDEEIQRIERKTDPPPESGDFKPKEGVEVSSEEVEALQDVVTPQSPDDAERLGKAARLDLAEKKWAEGEPGDPIPEEFEAEYGGEIGEGVEGDWMDPSSPQVLGEKFVEELPGGEAQLDKEAEEWNTQAMWDDAEPDVDKTPAEGTWGFIDSMMEDWEKEPGAMDEQTEADRESRKLLGERPEKSPKGDIEDIDVGQEGEEIPTSEESLEYTEGEKEKRRDIEGLPLPDLKDIEEQFGKETPTIDLEALRKSALALKQKRAWEQPAPEAEALPEFSEEEPWGVTPTPEGTGQAGPGGSPSGRRLRKKQLEELLKQGQ